jgi:capsular exopolysaccharide synthesis family protein
MADAQETLHFLDYWRVIRSRKEIIIAVSLLVIVTGVLVTLALPRIYRASCIIQVREERPDVDVFRQEAVRFDPLFLRTQFEIIQSRPVLEEVIHRRNLNEKLGRAYGYLEELGPRSEEQTFKIVISGIRAQHYRDTNLIEIQVEMAEPRESVRSEVAEVANEIARVFRDQNTKRSRESTERALTALQESLEEQDRRVNEAAKAVEKIRREQKIDVVSPTMGAYGTLDKMSVAQLEAMRIRVRTELARKETRYRMIIGLSQDDLLDAAPYMIGDVQLQQLVGEKRKGDVDLSEKLQTMGANHPEVVQTRARITGLEREINDALDGLKRGIQADYEAEKASYEIIQSELEEMKSQEREAEAERYQEFEQAQQELERLRRIRDALEVRALQERIEMHMPRTTVDVMAHAKVPEENDYVRPKILLNIILSILVGVATGVGLAFFIEYLDTSVKTIEDIERDMNVPVLGVIPQKVKPFIDATADTAHAEPYRVLRTNIQVSKNFKDGGALCVTSGSVGEGKTLTVFNIAFVCAQLGDKVLIVDADLHRPRQHKIFGIPRNIGLANVLLGDCAVEDAIVRTSVTNLDFLPSGKVATGVHGLLDGRRLRELIDGFKQAYDYVVIDAPPIIGVSDASLLIREVDGVLLVIQHRKYPKSVSIRARDMIRNMGANLVGVVLNNINISRDYSYYYHYTYHYYGKEKDKDKGA